MSQSLILFCTLLQNFCLALSIKPIRFIKSTMGVINHSFLSVLICINSTIHCIYRIIICTISVFKNRFSDWKCVIAMVIKLTFLLSNSLGEPKQSSQPYKKNFHMRILVVDQRSTNTARYYYESTSTGCLSVADSCETQ